MSGMFFEEFEVGTVVRHSLGRTISEADNVLFCALTMNTQSLHLNEDYAAKHSPYGRRIVNGILTLGLAVGISVPDLTEGTLVANLGYDSVRHPHPMFHGDTLYVETTVMEKRESRSHPEAGVVRFRHIGRNQRDEIVLDCERIALMQRRAV
jgi:acyl dehydratase